MANNGLISFIPRKPGQRMTGAERMAAFRERNPGYDRKYNAQRKARIEAVRAKREATAEVVAEKVVLTLPLPEYRLALPAPVVDPVVVEMNAMIARLKALKAETSVPVRLD